MTVQKLKQTRRSYLKVHTLFDNVRVYIYLLLIGFCCCVHYLAISILYVSMCVYRVTTNKNLFYLITYFPDLLFVVHKRE